MMLRQFDTELDRLGVTRMVKITDDLRIEQTVTVAPISSATQMLKQQERWGWEELRDYVFTEIERRFGPFPKPEGYKQKAIFESFLQRWDDRAAPIARAAFEVFDGRWAGAPVSIYRFCRNSDAFFAAVIAERLLNAGMNPAW